MLANDPELLAILAEELGTSSVGNRRATDFDNQEDAALHRLQQRAADRRCGAVCAVLWRDSFVCCRSRRQMARIADENTSEEERARLQRDLERDRVKQVRCARVRRVSALCSRSSSDRYISVSNISSSSSSR